MTRPLRFLTTRLNSTSSSSTAASVVAEPPEAVAAESDFVVILAALLCALICVIGLLSVARCAWLRRSAASNGRPFARSNRGLKKKTLQSLPKLTYDAAAAAAEAKFSAECAICLTEYADGDEIRDLPQCGHRFHVGCIDTWLGSHSSCPSCRQILVAARCGKCGELPAIYGAGSQAEAEMKAREDREGSSSGCLPDHRV